VSTHPTKIQYRPVRPSGACILCKPGTAPSWQHRAMGSHCVHRDHPMAVTANNARSNLRHRRSLCLLLLLRWWSRWAWSRRPIDEHRRRSAAPVGVSRHSTTKLRTTRNLVDNPTYVDSSPVIQHHHHHHPRTNPWGRLPRGAQ